jgi:uncharacterized membrane protein YccF (DUF307 family)
MGIRFTTIVGRPYARLCWKLKNYFLWPFGKYITVCTHSPLHCNMKT